MPAFSAAPRRAISTLSLGFRDFVGKPGPSTFEVSPAITDAEVAAIAASIGGMSNARLLESHRKNSSVQINNYNVLNTTFDEAYPSVKDVGIMVFQNSVSGAVRYVDVPAIDAQFFISGGEIFIQPDGDADAGTAPLLLQTAIDNLLAGFGANWVYVRGYKKGSGERQGGALPIVEPTGAPSDAPGV